MTSPSSSSSVISTPSLSVEDIDVDVDPPSPSTVESSRVKPKTPPTDQLQIDFHVLRITVLTVLVLGLVAAVLAVAMGDGIRLRTFTARNINSTKTKQLLDDYNSNVGTLTTGFNKVVDFVLEILVAIACLALLAKWTAQSQANPLLNHAPKLAVGALSFLVCNGPTSINVQIVPGTLHARISATDLTRRVGNGSEPMLTGNGTQLLSPWNKSFSETSDANPVLNTALRAHFLPFQRIKTRCKGGISGGIFNYPTVAVTTPTEDWVLTALPVAIAPDQSFTLYPLTDGPSFSDYKMARTLFVVAAISLVNDFNFVITHARSRMITSINDSMAINAPNCILNEKTTYSNMLDCASDDIVSVIASQAFENFLAPISHDSRVVHYTHRLADSITFSSLTVNFSINANYESDRNSLNVCSEEGCIITYLEGLYNRLDPMVGIARLDSSSNESTDVSHGPLVVLSIGKRLEGDSFDVNENDQGVILKGLRMRFTLTVGLLEWELEDLDQVLNAECDSTDGCEGLRVVNSFLSEQNRVALVGRSELQFSDLTNVAESLDEPFSDPPSLPWTYLLATSTINGELVALPRRFTNVGENVAPYLASQTSSACNAATDRYIKGVEINHLYMEDSLQTGYTAAFYYLIQNAVLHTHSASTGIVEFGGNYQENFVMASIPPRNAIFSLAGCAVLLGMCAAIAVAHKRGKKIIEANSSASMIAQAMLNDSKYPRAVLSLWLDRVSNDVKTASHRVNLDDVVFERAEFRDKLEPSTKSRKSVSTTV